MPRVKMDPELRVRVKAALKTGKCPPRITQRHCDDMEKDFHGEAKCVECWRRSLSTHPKEGGK